MPILGFEIEEIERLLALMDASDLDEIEWEGENRCLKVVGIRTTTAPQPAAPAALALPRKSRSAGTLNPRDRRAAQRAIAPKEVVGFGADEVALESPMVGVFYRSGKPGDPPLVEIGQIVARDQPIGIIEAMKIFSEILAEHGGVVIAVPAVDGQLVQAGTPLVILKKRE